VSHMHWLTFPVNETIEKSEGGERRESGEKGQTMPGMSRYFDNWRMKDGPRLLPRRDKYFA
jgi:hypothetical protein